jgi:hypothetical protein
MQWDMAAASRAGKVVAVVTTEPRRAGELLNSQPRDRAHTAAGPARRADDGAN